MTIRMMAAVAALGVLAACAAPVPDSNPNSGVGFRSFDDYTAERAARDRALEARALAEAEAMAPAPEEMVIAQETLGVLEATAPVRTAEVAPTPTAAATPTQASDPGAPLAGTTLLTSNPAISDEQNFDAVAARETIESDRDRLSRQRATMQIAQPEALPDRPSGSGPNIVAFALATSNRVGEARYQRSGGFNQDRYNRACTRFGWTDQAQSAFLEAGGPERDRRGLDPDGDGFACRWDPTPFRNARRGG